MNPTATAAPAPTARSSRSAAFTLVFATLLAALVARQVFALWERYDGSTTYDELRGFGDAFWPMNLLVFGPAFAIGFAAQAALAWSLGRGRARLVTGSGAVLLLIGGVEFALVATAHALPFDWAANHGVLDETTGRIVVDAFDTGGTPLLLPYILAAQAAIALGALVTVIGARVSRTIPTWLLVVTVLFLAAYFFVPSAPGSVVEMVVSFAQAALWAVIGWFGWRTASRS